MPEKEKLTEARDILIDACGRNYALYGLPEVIGRIYGILYFSDQPMGLEDIAHELQVSKATVSINVRILEGLKTVRKVWLKGSRRDYYEAKRDVSMILVEHLKDNFSREREITSTAIKRSKALLAEMDDSPDEQVQQKLKSYYDNLHILEQQYEWSEHFFNELLQASKKQKGG